MTAHRPSASIRRSGRSARGYTLLEIALVVTIIVLLVGAVVPLSSGFIREQRMRDAVRELLVLAKTARTEAMTDKPLKPDGQRWIFQPTGLCEPVSVRIIENEAWIEVRFDPLTAGIEEETYNIP